MLLTHWADNKKLRGRKETVWLLRGSMLARYTRYWKRILCGHY